MEQPGCVVQGSAGGHGEAQEVWFLCKVGGPASGDAGFFWEPGSVVFPGMVRR